MKATSLHIALFTTILVGGLAAAGTASAIFRDVSAGSACEAASGGASGSFSYSNNYLTNIGTTPQFVICHFQMEDATAAPGPTTYLVLHAQSTQAVARAVTCSAQTGSFYFGVNHIISNNVRTHSFATAGHATLVWSAAAIVRNQPYDVFTMNCRLDPGTRIGLIEYQSA